MCRDMGLRQVFFFLSGTRFPTLLAASGAASIYSMEKRVSRDRPSNLGFQAPRNRASVGHLKLEGRAQARSFRRSATAARWVDESWRGGPRLARGRQRSFAQIPPGRFSPNRADANHWRAVGPNRFELCKGLRISDSKRPPGWARPTRPCEWGGAVGKRREVRHSDPRRLGGAGLRSAPSMASP